MSNITTCAVKGIIHESEGGVPAVGATIEVQLAYYDIYQGFVAPEKTIFKTDENGEVVMDLFPNALGQAASFYEIRIKTKNKTFKTIAVVPNLPTALLHEIVDLPPYDGQPTGAIILARIEALLVLYENLIPKFLPNAPPNPLPGAQWTDADTGKTYEWIVTASSSAWFETGSAETIGYETAIQAAQSAAEAAASAVDAQTAEDGAKATLAVFASAAPANPLGGLRWTSAITGKTYEFINDGNSGQWVETGSAQTVSATAFAAALATPATLDAYGFTAAVVQDTLDNAKALQSYAAMLAYTGRAVGVRITTPGIAGVFRYNTALPNTTNGASRFAHASGTGAWERIEARLTIRMFGAAMDGATDDVVAIEKACESGLPLDWEGGPYRISRQIGSAAKTLAKIDWVSRGATVVLDAGAAQQQAAIYYIVSPAVAHVIRGSGLTFDASSKANIACWFHQAANSRTGTFYAEGLGGINARRSAAFSSGNGILVRGGFKRVDLIRPVAKNVLLPAGAGTPGTVGVQGIGVLRGGVGESYPEYTYIENPIVEEVRSEDAAYTSDQDGIAVFGATDAPGAGYSRFDVVGGSVTNAWGRSIKGQTSYGTVRGTRLAYTSAPTGGVGAGVLVDFQTGPGRVTDLDVSLDGVSTAGIVAFQTPVNGSWSAGTWVGGYVVAINGATIGQLVSNYARQANFGMFGIEDVTVNGTLTYIGNVATPNDKTTFVARRIQVSNLTGALARVASGGAVPVAPYVANVVAENCTNQGAQVPLTLSNIAGNSATCTIDQRGCVGFGPDSIRISPGEATKAGLQQIGALVGAYANGGAQKLYATVLAAGAEFEFPAHGYQNSVFIALVSMAHSVGTQGLVWVGATAVSGVVGANVGVGASAEPATGLLRIWKGTTGLRVKNTDASSRVVSVLFFG